MPNFLECAREAQHGRIPMKGTALCAHFSRSFFGYARECGLSSAQIYVDVVGAFDTVLRQLLFDTPITDTIIAFVIKGLGCGPEVMHELAKHIADQSFLADTSMSPYTRRCLQECHESTWFSTQGLQVVAGTEVGSIPGDPLGDIVFNFISSRVHGTLEVELHEAGLLSEIDAPPCLATVPGHPTRRMRLFDNVYVDDAAFMLLASCAHALIVKTARAAQIIRDVYASFFLVLNMKPGKSEVMLRLCGNKSKQI